MIFSLFNLGLFFLPFLSLNPQISSSFKLSYLFFVIIFAFSKTKINFYLLGIFLFGSILYIITPLIDTRINTSSIIDSSLSYGLMFLIIIFFYNYVQKEPLYIGLFLNVLRKGIYALFILGLIQLIIYSINGTNIFPINIANHLLYGDKAVTAKELISGISFFRVNSLAGEPKTFGMYLAILPLISHLKELLNIEKFRKTDFIVSLFGVILSASTSALFVLIFISLFIFFRKPLILISSKALFLYFSFFTFLVIILLYFYEVSLVGNMQDSNQLEDNGKILGYINSRIFSRIGLEDHDYVSLKIIKQNLTYFFIGGVTYYLKYLTTPEILSTVWFYQGVYFVPKSGLIYLISTFGIIGLIIISISFYKLFILNNKIYKRDDILFLFMLITIFFARYYLWDILSILFICTIVHRKYNS